MQAAAARAMIDGAPMPLHAARLRLTDAGVSLGDGAFETVGVWAGHPFRLDAHLDRLDASLAALSLPPAPRALLVGEARTLVEGVDADAALRLYVTASGTRVVSLTPIVPISRKVLVPQPAPWLQPGSAGAKSMSYAMHLAARRRAVAEGADDAVLVSVPDGIVLEGSTFSLLFVARGVVHAPDTDLGIVDSISRRAVLEVARAHDLDVLVGRWPLEALADADEVLTCSSIRPVAAVNRIGQWTYGRSHPVTALLGAGLQDLRSGAG